MLFSPCTLGAWAQCNFVFVLEIDFMLCDHNFISINGIYRVLGEFNTSVSILAAEDFFCAPALQVNPAATTIPREKRGLFIDHDGSQLPQEPPISSVSSVVLACKQDCLDAFMASIYPIKHYFNLASPFSIFRRIWDAYEKLDRCQRACLGKMVHDWYLLHVSINWMSGPECIHILRAVWRQHCTHI